MITYKTGDLFATLDEQPADAILHVVNNVGAWGAGFVVPLGNRYPKAKDAYQNSYESYELGDAQKVETTELTVYNLFAQDGIEGDAPIRYDALAESLRDVAEKQFWPDLFMPRIGCGLAGGSWDAIEPIIEEELSDFSVTVFTLPQDVPKFS